MDKLNKLRLLAGVPVRYTPSARPSNLMEGKLKDDKSKKLAPKSKKNMQKRVKCVNEAAVHLSRARQALEQVPAVDYLNDVSGYIHQISGLLEGYVNGKDGIKALLETYQAEYNTLKTLKEGFDIDPPVEDDEYLKDPSEFAELSADADAEAYGKLGDEEDVTSPEVVAKIAAYAQEAGLGDEEGMGDEMDAGVDPDLVGDDRQLDDLGDDLEGDEDEFTDDELDDDFEGDESMDGDFDSAMASAGHGTDEDYGDFGSEDDDRMFDESVRIDELSPATMSSYMDKSSQDVSKREKVIDDSRDLNGRPTVGKRHFDKVNQRAKGRQRVRGKMAEAAPAITDKNESPNQLDHTDPSPAEDHEKKVSVPSSIKTALRTHAATARKEAKELGVADKDAKWFYENLATMFEELLGHLERGTVLDIKKAQIFMSSLMGPMLHKIPAEVVNFVANGGAERTLKDYMKPVDKKYPVTGKMYKGE